jgi:hypothetical protein
LDVQNVAELTVLPQRLFDSRGTFLDGSADAKKGDSSFGEVADNLMLKPTPLLLSASIPGVVIRDVGIAEEAPRNLWLWCALTSGRRSGPRSRRHRRPQRHTLSPGVLPGTVD